MIQWSQALVHQAYEAFSGAGIQHLERDTWDVQKMRRTPWKWTWTKERAPLFLKNDCLLVVSRLYYSLMLMSTNVVKFGKNNRSSSLYLGVNSVRAVDVALFSGASANNSPSTAAPDLPPDLRTSRENSSETKEDIYRNKDLTWNTLNCIHLDSTADFKFENWPTCFASGDLPVGQTKLNLPQAPTRFEAGSWTWMGVPSGVRKLFGLHL